MLLCSKGCDQILTIPLCNPLISLDFINMGSVWTWSGIEVTPELYSDSYLKLISPHKMMSWLHCPLKAQLSECMYTETTWKCDEG